MHKTIIKNQLNNLLVLIVILTMFYLLEIFQLRFPTQFRLGYLNSKSFSRFTSDFFLFTLFLLGGNSKQMRERHLSRKKLNAMKMYYFFLFAKGMSLSICRRYSWKNNSLKKWK